MGVREVHGVVDHGRKVRVVQADRLVDGPRRMTGQRTMADARRAHHRIDRLQRRLGDLQRRVEERELLGRAEEQRHEARGARHRRRLEDEVDPVAAGAGRYRELDAFVRGAHQVRVHPAHRLALGMRVVREVVVRLARGERRTGASCKYRCRNVHARERREEHARLDDALTERVAHRDQVVHVDVVDVLRAGDALGADRQRLTRRGEPQRREGAARPAIRRIAEITAVDDLLRDAARAVEVDDERIAAGRHGLLRDANRDRHRLVALLLGEPVRTDVEEALGREDGGALLELGHHDLRANVAELGLRVRRIGLEGQIGEVRCVRLDHQVAERRVVGDDVAGREHRRADDVRARHADLVERLPERRVELLQRRSLRARRDLSARQRRERGRGLRLAAGVHADRACDHERELAVRREHDAGPRCDREEVLGHVGVRVRRLRDDRVCGATLGRCRVDVEEEQRRLDAAVDGELRVALLQLRGELEVRCGHHREALPFLRGLLQADEDRDPRIGKRGDVGRALRREAQVRRIREIEESVLRREARLRVEGDRDGRSGRRIAGAARARRHERGRERKEGGEEG